MVDITSSGPRDQRAALATPAQRDTSAPVTGPEADRNATVEKRPDKSGEGDPSSPAKRIWKLIMAVGAVLAIWSRLKEVWAAVITAGPVIRDWWRSF